MVDRNTALFEAHVDLVRLALLMAQGQRNTEAANELRDDLAAYEAGLDSREIAFLNYMSADLYMIENGEVYQKPLEAYKTPEQLSGAIYEAYRRQDWTNLLIMLRQEATFLPAGVRAYLRGRAYESLGFYAAAWAFFQYAASRDNDRAAYDYFALDNLARLNREEAKRQADNYLSDPSAHPALKILAASIILRYFRGVEDQHEADIKQIARALLPALGEAANRNDVPTQVIAAGYASLYGAFDALKDYANARDALRLAQGFNPKFQETQQVQLEIEKLERLIRNGQSVDSDILINLQQIEIDQEARPSNFQADIDTEVNDLLNHAGTRAA